MITAKNLFYTKALLTFLVSPVYIPVVILWNNRQDILDFYKECWQVVNGTHPELKD